MTQYKIVYIKFGYSTTFARLYPNFSLRTPWKGLPAPLETLCSLAVAHVHSLPNSVLGNERTLEGGTNAFVVHCHT